MSLDSLFDQFIRERIYVKNVTPATREWYETAWKAFKASRSSAAPDVITRADLTNFVVHLRERQVKPVSCNTWVRAMNAFCRWLHEQGAAPKLERLPPQRLGKRLLATHDDRALRLFLTFRPKDFRQARIHAVACTVLDTGCRIQELLTAKCSDFDFDQLLLTVFGKGRKERRVPFSTSLRKVLFRYKQMRDGAAQSDLMFPAVGGHEWENVVFATPRASINGAKALRLGKLSRNQVEQALLWGRLSAEDAAKVKANLWRQ
jgi:integrase/recombinase XerD